MLRRAEEHMGAQRSRQYESDQAAQPEGEFQKHAAEQGHIDALEHSRRLSSGARTW
jgi:hypothetical protein